MDVWKDVIGMVLCKSMLCTAWTCVWKGVIGMVLCWVARVHRVDVCMERCDRYGVVLCTACGRGGSGMIVYHICLYTKNRYFTYYGLYVTMVLHYE